MGIFGVLSECECEPFLFVDDEAAEDEAPDEQDALEQRGLLVVVAVAVAVVGEEIGGDEGHRPFERVAVGR